MFSFLVYLLDTLKLHMWLILYFYWMVLLEINEENKDGLIDILVFMLKVNNSLENFLVLMTQSERERSCGRGVWNQKSSFY